MIDVAKIFYAKCCGTYPGHMSNVANNPEMYSMLAAISGSEDGCHAMSQKDFVEFLRMAADCLDIKE